MTKDGNRIVITPCCVDFRNDRRDGRSKLIDGTISLDCTQQNSETATTDLLGSNFKTAKRGFGLPMAVNLLFRGANTRLHSGLNDP